MDRAAAPREAARPAGRPRALHTARPGSRPEDPVEGSAPDPWVGAMTGASCSTVGSAGGSTVGSVGGSARGLGPRLLGRVGRGRGLFARGWPGHARARVLLVDERARGAEADDAHARRHHIRVARAVPAARPVRNGRAGPTLAGLGRVGGPDGEHERVVRGVGEPCATAVPCRDHHDDALAPGDLDGERERVDAVGLARVGAEREIEHANVEPVRLAVLDDPVDGGDHLRHVGCPERVRDLEADDARARRDAAKARRFPGRGRR